MAHIYIFIMQEKKGYSRPVFADYTLATFPVGRGQFSTFVSDWSSGMKLNAWEETTPIVSEEWESCLDHEGTYRPRKN